MPPVTSSPALGLDADGRLAKLAWRIAADAHTAAGLLTLDVFAPEFEKWGMVTNVEDEIGKLGVGSAF